MYIYRLINELDEKINPLKNGLVARSIIDGITSKEFNFLIYAESIKNERNLLEKFSSKNIRDIYKEIRKISIENNLFEILTVAKHNQEQLNKQLESIFKNKNENNLECIISILKNINGHITNGYEKDYPWISFSTDLNAIKKYYEHQNINSVVVIDSQNNLLFDECNNDILLAVDLSNRESIQNNPFLINNLGLKTRENYRGYNYAINSKEIVYYNRVPKEKIVTILKSLQYELLINGLLDEEYYRFSELKKIEINNKILYEMKELFKNDSDIVNYILEEYYKKSNSLKYLSEQGIYNLRQLENTKEYINQKMKEKYKHKIY